MAVSNVDSMDPPFLITMKGTWNSIAMCTAKDGFHMVREDHNLVTIVKENHNSFVQSPISCLAVIA